MPIFFKRVVLAAVITIVAIPFGASAQSSLPKLETDVAKQPAGEYIVDKAHASVIWRVTHMGLSQYTARFDVMRGTLNLNPAAMAASRVEFTIDAKSVNTGLAPFDKKLQSNDYLDADRNGTITFKSSNIELGTGNKFKLLGDLTFRGITKPISWDATFNGGHYSKFMQAHQLGFSAKGIVKRSNWDLKTYLDLIGDDVEVTIEVEFLHRPEVLQ
jgi:polyisoprenoid-binding protein YceI